MALKNQDATIKICLIGLEGSGKTTTLNSIINHNQNHSSPKVLKKETEVFLNIHKTNALIKEIRISRTLQSSKLKNTLSIQNQIKEFQKIILVVNLKDFAKNIEILKILLASTNVPIILAINFAEETDPEEISNVYRFFSKLNPQIAVTTINPQLGVNIEKLQKFISSKTNSIKNKNSIQEIKKIEKQLDKFLSQKSCSKLNKLSKSIDRYALNPYLKLPIFFTIILLMFWTIIAIGGVLGDWISDIIIKTTFRIESMIPPTIHIFRTFNTQAFLSAFTEGIIPGLVMVISALPRIIILNLWIMLLDMTKYMTRISLLTNRTLSKFGLPNRSIFSLLGGLGCSVPGYESTKSISNKIDRFLTMIMVSFTPCHGKMIVTIFLVNIFFEKTSALLMILLYISSITIGLITAKIASIILKHKLIPEKKILLPNYQKPQFSIVWNKTINTTKIYIRETAKIVTWISLALWILSHVVFLKSADNEGGKRPVLMIPFQAEQRTNPLKNGICNQDLKYQINSNMLEGCYNNNVIYYPSNNKLNSYLAQNSILGKIGNITSILFKPLGFDSKLSISLLTALSAKEISLATLGVLYSDVDNQNGDKAISAMMKKDIPKSTALSYVFFTIIWLPCLSAITTFWKRSENKKWVMLFLIAETSIAWVGSFILKTILSYLM